MQTMNFKMITNFVEIQLNRFVNDLKYFMYREVDAHVGNEFRSEF